jgi:hypothetical protein
MKSNVYIVELYEMLNTLWSVFFFSVICYDNGLFLRLLGTALGVLNGQWGKLEIINF